MAYRAQLYLETSVVSYFVADPSRDVIVHGHQMITKEWWGKHLEQYDVFVSPIVIEEVRAGNPRMAESRLQAIRSFPLLSVTPAVDQLAALYLRRGVISGKSLRDAYHIALASVHEMDYLVTWNCSHIANVEIRRRLAAIHQEQQVWLPIVCTPEEMMED